MRVVRTLSTVGVVAAFAGSAQAASVLQFDINAMSASTGGAAFSTTFTGTITLSMNTKTTLTEVLIDGSAQGIAAGLLNDFSGTITLANGVVTGGSFTIEDTSLNTYSASIISGSGSATPSAGQTGPFRIDGLTFLGTFSSNTFATVDVSDWFNAQPLGGSFLQFKFGPNMAGVDDDADIDIFVVVPTPTAFGLAGLGLVGIGAARRRR